MKLHNFFLDDAHKKLSEMVDNFDEDVEKSKEKYKDTPVPETLTDIAELFTRIKKMCPNSVLHCAGYGSPLPTGVTMTATAPVGIRNEMRRAGVDPNHPLINDALDGEGEDSSRLDDIVDKDTIMLPILMDLLINVAREQNYDLVKMTKRFNQLAKVLRAKTGQV